MKRKEDETAALQAEIRSLKRKLESQDEELKCINKLYESSHWQKCQHNEKRRNQVHQAKLSCEVEVTQNALNEADQELYDAMRAFIANDVKPGIKTTRRPLRIYGATIHGMKQSYILLLTFQMWILPMTGLSTSSSCRKIACHTSCQVLLLLRHV